MSAIFHVYNLIRSIYVSRLARNSFSGCVDGKSRGKSGAGASDIRAGDIRRCARKS